MSSQSRTSRATQSTLKSSAAPPPKTNMPEQVWVAIKANFVHETAMNNPVPDNISIIITEKDFMLYNPIKPVKFSKQYMTGFNCLKKKIQPC